MPEKIKTNEKRGTVIWMTFTIQMMKAAILAAESLYLKILYQWIFIILNLEYCSVRETKIYDTFFIRDGGKFSSIIIFKGMPFTIKQDKWETGVHFTFVLKSRVQTCCLSNLHNEYQYGNWVCTAMEHQCRQK